MNILTLPKVPYDFYGWDTKPTALKKNNESRKNAGICAMDVWNFDNFMTALFANAVLLTASTRSIFNYPEPDIYLPNITWGAIKSNHSVLKNDSFDDELTTIVRTFQAYNVNSELYNGFSEEIRYALTSFLTLLPYLSSNEHPFNHRVEKHVYPDVDPMIKKRCEDDSVRYAFNENDATYPYAHVTSVLAVGFKALAQTTHGHPGDMNESSWEKYLLELSDGFKNYALQTRPVAIDEEFIKKFVTRFGSYWD